MAYKAKEPLSYNQLKNECGVWKSRALRRGKMLSELATFLRSVNAHSDRACKEQGLPRSDVAASLYHLARQLAELAEQEIKNDRTYDDCRNYTDRADRLEARRKRGDDPSPRTASGRNPASRTGRTFALSRHDVKRDRGNGGLHSDQR